MTKKLVCPKCKNELSHILDISEEYAAYPLIRLDNGEWEITSSQDKQLRYTETIAYECPICSHRETDNESFVVERLQCP